MDEFYIENGRLLGGDLSERGEIIIPDGIREIGRSAFSFAKAERIVIPEGVKKIGKHAFMCCERLKEIILPDSLEEIGENAFSFDYSLFRIVLPENLKCIKKGAFRGCNSLVEIVNESSINLEVGSKTNGSVSKHAKNILKNRDDSDIREEGNFVIYKEKLLLKYTGDENFVNIPDFIENIGPYAFCTAESVVSITVPESVKEIHGNAFRGCFLKEIENRSVCDIRDKSCDRVIKNKEDTKLTVTEDGLIVYDNKEVVKFIGHGRDIIIPDGVKIIASKVFMNCDFIESISFPLSLEEINYGAFESCISLKAVSIPSGITSVDFVAFKDCTSLEKVTLPDAIKLIDNFAFAGCTSLKEIKMPAGLITINGSAFINCTSLESIYVPDRCSEIYSHAFFRCTSLSRVRIPGSIKHIEFKSFAELGDHIPEIIYDGTREEWNKISVSPYAFEGSKVIIKCRDINLIIRRGRWDKRGLEEAED